MNLNLQPLGQGANGGIFWNFSVQCFDLSNPKFESKDFDLLIVLFQIGLITITRSISSILDPKDLQMLDFGCYFFREMMISCSNFGWFGPCVEAFQH